MLSKWASRREGGKGGRRKGEPSEGKTATGEGRRRTSVRETDLCARRRSQKTLWRKEEAKKMKRTERTAAKVTERRARKDGDDERKEERTVEVVQAKHERECH
jgi:hypothetical protein